jgi:hypothetical protein
MPGFWALRCATEDEDRYQYEHASPLTKQAFEQNRNSRRAQLYLTAYQAGATTAPL